MKNENVHKKLFQEEIRNFIGGILHTNYYGDLELLEKKMKELQEQIERAKIHSAITFLMKHRGWDWFDVSDEIEDYNTETYVGFVGTDEEYDELMKKIAKEK